MAKCKLCNKELILISCALNLCADCIQNDFASALPYIQQAHAQVRQTYKLPSRVPQDSDGKICNLCVNACQVEPGRVGFCGLPIGLRQAASLSWYYDPLPTNCVADWVCKGSYDFGYKNLAVFYNTCQELAEKVDARTTCICYFGGDPTPQLPHSILASRIARDLNKGRTLRICWETNGSMSRQYLREVLEISLESDGCVKFDLKAWTESLNIALCGVTNKQTLENFKFAATYIDKRPDPPLLVASTLLIPGYIDIYEVEKIAKFIVSLNSTIPYSLLAFHPQFQMSDLPTTSRTHAEKARDLALKAGLINVRIGNIQLLGDDYTV